MHTHEVQRLKIRFLVVVLSIASITVVSCGAGRHEGSDVHEASSKPTAEFSKIDSKSIHVLQTPTYKFDPRISDFWVPSSTDVEKSLAVIEKSFQDSTFMKTRTTDKKSIIENIGTYQFQIVGTIIEGKKRVYVNAMKMTSGESTRGIDKDISTVFDGGWSFWQAEVDIESDTLTIFNINGYA